MTKTLNWHRLYTGNQCSSFKTGVSLYVPCSMFLLQNLLSTKSRNPNFWRDIYDVLIWKFIAAIKKNCFKKRVFYIILFISFCVICTLQYEVVVIFFFNLYSTIKLFSKLSTSRLPSEFPPLWQKVTKVFLNKYVFRNPISPKLIWQWKISILCDRSNFFERKMTNRVIFKTYHEMIGD